MFLDLQLICLDLASDSTLTVRKLLVNTITASAMSLRSASSMPFSPLQGLR